MESQKNRFMITSHLTYGENAGKRSMTIKDARYRQAQQRLVLTETKCKEMDALAQEDHTYMATQEELERYRSTWNSTIKSSNIQWSIGSSTRL